MRTVSKTNLGGIIVRNTGLPKASWQRTSPGTASFSMEVLHMHPSQTVVNVQVSESHITASGKVVTRTVMGDLSKTQAVAIRDALTRFIDSQE